MSYHDDWRRTGRTTRMIVSALDAITDGKSVAIIFHTGRFADLSARTAMDLIVSGQFVASLEGSGMTVDDVMKIFRSRSMSAAQVANHRGRGLQLDKMFIDHAVWELCSFDEQDAVDEMRKRSVKPR